MKYVKCPVCKGQNMIKYTQKEWYCENCKKVTFLDKHYKDSTGGARKIMLYFAGAVIVLVGYLAVGPLSPAHLTFLHGWQATPEYAWTYFFIAALIAAAVAVYAVFRHPYGHIIPYTFSGHYKRIKEKIRDRRKL